MKGSQSVEQTESIEIFLGMWKERMSTAWPKGVDSGSKWRAGRRQTDVRLDRWFEGGLGQQRNDGGGWMSFKHG